MKQSQQQVLCFVAMCSIGLFACSGGVLAAENNEETTSSTTNNSPTSENSPEENEDEPLQTQFSYQTMVQTKGWTAYTNAGKVSGTTGKSLSLEGVRIESANFSGNIETSVYNLASGWQKAVGAGSVARSQVKGKKIEGIKINLTGPVAKEYDIFYRVHAQHWGWLGWTKNGGKAGTARYGDGIEALQIVLQKKSSSRLVASNKSFRENNCLLLDVPLVKQRPELPTGCEITAVTMMLNYVPKKVSKTVLAKEMPKHLSNPTYGYVGNPFLESGWTIYPPALKPLVTKYAGSFVNLTGKGISSIEAQLERDKPVVAWVVMDGFPVHAITMTGYDRQHLYFNNPWTGRKNHKITKKAFLKLWTMQKKRAISY